MRIHFFKLFLLVVVLTLSNGSLLAQFEWEKYQTNPLAIHGSSGSWDESVVTPCVIFNSDLNQYEMWFGTFDGTYPNNGIGFAWSTDGITWTKHPTPVMTPSGSGWDAVSVGECSVIKEGNVYKMWYTGHPNSTRTPSYIGYATSTNGGITWAPYAGNPVLSPGTGWESARVEFPSVIKVTGGYWMFYTGESAPGVARTGRAFSTDGINWQKDNVNNPVLLPGAPGEWDQNNYLGNVIELNNTLYIYYTGETNPGVSGTAIGVAASTDMGITWTKYTGNPIIQRGATGQWDNGWIETGCAVFARNQLKLYYDGGGAATGFLGRIGLAISDPLPAGTYTIGTGGNFATIQDAFTKLETDGVAGAVTLELIDDLYTAPVGQYGYVLNGPITGTGPSIRVTIKPAENKNVTIEGDNEGLLFLINTSYVTFDGVGLAGATTLTIHALQNLTYTYNDALDFLDNSDHNIIQNINFIVDNITSASGSGFWYSQTGSAPDSNLIQNNFVKKAGDAFFIISASASLKGKDNAIIGNIIGSETDSLIAVGIEVQSCENTLIENNIVQNLKATLNGTDQIQVGILSEMCSGTIIRNNVLRNFRATSGYSASGIFLGIEAGGTGSDNRVYNNMIYNIQSLSTQNDSRVSGIEVWGQNNPKIYYNSVYLSGTGSQQSGSAALYIGSGNSGIDSKNNILVNTRDESPYWASAIYDQTASNLTSDYNDLYYQTNQFNCLVRIGSTNYNTLADWQATGKDLNSLNESVNFISPTDLHINNNYYTLLDGHATPIVEIDTDFDGDVRSATTPDIGADEFDVDPNATIWQLQDSHFPSDVFVCDFSAPDNQICWAVGLKYSQGPYTGYIRTVDGGNTWVCDTIPGLSNCYTQQVFAIDADTAYVTVFKLIGTTGSNGVYKTTDAGTTWIRQDAYNNSQSGPAYIHFFDTNNGVVIGDPGIETYTTTNGGLTWNPVTMPAIPSNEYTASRGDGIVAVGNTVWFSTGAHLFKSTDKGYTWITLLNEPQYINWSGGLAFQDESTGIYSQKQGANFQYRKTADGGLNWNNISDPVLSTIAPTTSQYIPGTPSTYIVGGGTTVTMSGIAVSYDGGNTWSLIDTVGSYQLIFPSSTVGWNSPFTIHNIYKYVGPRIIPSVEEEIIDLVPTGYSLAQNYPNPFNPSTTFRYSIPTQSKVVIKVYDILGNEIATLMDEEKPVGTYELTWNAENLPSGVYFYQLRSGSFVETKKMLLLK